MTRTHSLNHPKTLGSHWTMLFGIWIALVIPFLAFSVSYSKSSEPIVRVSGETITRQDSAVTWTTNFIPNESAAILQQRALLSADQASRVQATAALNRLAQQWSKNMGVPMKDWSVWATLPTWNKIVIAVKRDLFISYDNGQTFEQLKNVLPSVVNSIAINPANENVLYAGADGLGFYTSEDNGNTWRASNAGIQVTPGARFGITAITVDADHPQTMYIAAGVWLGTGQVTYYPIGILKTIDGGKTWTQFDTETVEPIQYLVLDANLLHAWSNGERTSYPLPN